MEEIIHAITITIITLFAIYYMARPHPSIVVSSNYVIFLLTKGLWDRQNR